VVEPPAVAHAVTSEPAAQVIAPPATRGLHLRDNDDDHRACGCCSTCPPWPIA